MNNRSAARESNATITNGRTTGVRVCDAVDCCRGHRSREFNAADDGPDEQRRRDSSSVVNSSSVREINPGTFYLPHVPQSNVILKLLTVGIVLMTLEQLYILWRAIMCSHYREQCEPVSLIFDRVQNAVTVIIKSIMNIFSAGR